MKSTRYFVLVSFGMLLVLGNGCIKTKESSLQTFINKKYGYSMELPKTWGAIQPYGESFTLNLYDDLEEIGPDLPTAFDENDKNQYYLSVEVFSDQNAKRENSQSWFDFYDKLRLQGNTYTKQKLDDNTTEIIFFGKPNQTCGLVKIAETNGSLSLENKCFDNNNDVEFYKHTCRLIEHKNQLYSFCYNNENNIHSNIVKSIKFE